MSCGGKSLALTIEAEQYLDGVQKELQNILSTAKESSAAGLLSVKNNRMYFNALYTIRPANATTAEYDGKREELFVPFDQVSGGIPIYVYTPTSSMSKSNPVILIYFHGGGNMAGSKEYVDPGCKLLSSKIGCILVSVEYRLLPEHKFPANMDDGFAVVKWVLDNKTVIGGSQTSKVGVAGDSAGGQISATLAHLVPGLDFQILIYPYLGGKPSELSSVTEFRDGPILDRTNVEWTINLMVDGKTEIMNDSRFTVFLNEKFDHLPPCLFIVAEYDMLRDISYEYSKKLTAAGVSNYVHVVKGVVHGFFQNPAYFKEATGEAYAKVAEFIDRL